MPSWTSAITRNHKNGLTAFSITLKSELPNLDNVESNLVLQPEELKKSYSYYKKSQNGFAVIYPMNRQMKIVTSFY